MAPHEGIAAVDPTLLADVPEGHVGVTMDDLTASVAVPGRRLGRFLVLGTLGQGGMGVVVEARDDQLDRTVALKLLHPSATRRHQTRLLREAQALARLSHPNVVQVYDVGTVGDRTFIAMELVSGRTLRQWQSEPRPWRETAELYLQAARGLAAAHAKGLAHRDFKPDNCMLGEDGRVRVVDFGLVREVRPPESSPSNPRTPETDETPVASPTSSGALGERLTWEGAVMGTLAYMSLEQLKGEPADARTDQYSLCASLHEALYGMRPYEGRTPASVMTAMMAGQRSTPRQVEGPRRLRRAICRGLSLDPAARWPTMDALIVELEAITRRRGWTAAVALGVGALLGGGVVLTRSQQPPCPDVDATLDGTWGEDHRRRLAETFAQHGPRDAEELLPRITGRLDEYARAWGEMAHESCTATFVTHRQSETLFDLRARCLERRRNHAASAVEALSEADDPGKLLQSAILPFKLPELAPCADLDALAERRPTAQERSLHDGHGPLRRRIDQAHTLRESGQLEGALALAEAARDEAAALEAPLLHAEALECLGRIQAEGGPMRDAKRTLEQAIVEANRVGDDEIAARAWLSLHYATTMQGDFEEAEHRTLGATAAVERVGDELLRAWLLNDLGVLALEKRDFGAARQSLEEALALKSRSLGEHHVDVGIAWFNLGVMLTSAKQARAAREPMTKALAIFEATVGRSHPLTGYALSGLCNVELGLDDFHAAVAVCERALARFESLPVAPVWEGRTRFTTAKALWGLGRHREAREMAQRAARVIAADDPEHAKWIDEWLKNHHLE